MIHGLLLGGLTAAMLAAQNSGNSNSGSHNSGSANISEQSEADAVCPTHPMTKQEDKGWSEGVGGRYIPHERMLDSQQTGGGESVGVAAPISKAATGSLSGEENAVGGSSSRGDGGNAGLIGAGQHSRTAKPGEDCSVHPAAKTGVEAGVPIIMPTLDNCIQCEPGATRPVCCPAE